MALEAIVFPQDFFSYTNDESFTYGKGSYSGYETPICELGSFAGDSSWDPFYSVIPNFEDLDANSPCPPVVKKENITAEAVGRRKRRRAKNVKNKEEIENQRMTHIAVERNRRRQMNEYLAVLRSLMPPSYAQRGDQASIVGGAINYVKELEQQLQSLEVQKKLKHKSVDKNKTVSPFAEFFTFPQYTSSLGGTSSCSDSGSSNNSYSGGSYSPNIHNATVVDSQPGLADVEVTMVESHVNLKMVTRRRPKQLVKIVACLQKMQLIPQHLNMTSADDRVMYSFSLKVEDESKLVSVDEIATAVYQMLGRIQEADF